MEWESKHKIIAAIVLVLVIAALILYNWGEIEWDGGIGWLLSYWFLQFIFRWLLKVRKIQGRLSALGIRFYFGYGCYNAKTKNQSQGLVFSFWLRGQDLLALCLVASAALRLKPHRRASARLRLVVNLLFRRFKSAAQCKNKKPVARTGLFFLVAGGGFEPPTFRLWAWRAKNKTLRKQPVSGNVIKPV